MEIKELSKILENSNILEDVKSTVEKSAMFLPRISSDKVWGAQVKWYNGSQEKVFSSEIESHYVNYEIPETDLAEAVRDATEKIGKEFSDLREKNFAKQIDGIFDNKKDIYGLQRLNGYKAKTIKNKSYTRLGEILKNACNHYDLILAAEGTEYRIYRALWGREIDSNNLPFTAINGVPIHYSPFLPKNTIYLLNTEDWELQQLSDFEWLPDFEDTENIVRKCVDKYEATVVKYDKLICLDITRQLRIVLNDLCQDGPIEP